MTSAPLSPTTGEAAAAGTARTPDNRATRVAASLVLAVLVVGFLIGYLAMDPSWVAPATASELAARQAADFGPTVATILLRNLGAAALLYSGVATAGVTSAVAAVLVSVYVGATARIGTAASGARQLVGEVVAYAPLELLGMALATTAGVLPALHALRRRRARAEGGVDTAGAGGGGVIAVIGDYLAAVPGSLAMLAASGAIIVVAAVIEAVLITGG